jgi:hypothetical protein
LLIYWEGLQKDAADKEKLIEGAHKLKQVAASVYARQDDGSRQLAIMTMSCSFSLLVAMILRLFGLLVCC